MTWGSDTLAPPPNIAWRLLELRPPPSRLRIVSRSFVTATIVVGPAASIVSGGVSVPAGVTPGRTDTGSGRYCEAAACPGGVVPVPVITTEDDGRAGEANEESSNRPAARYAAATEEPRRIGPAPRCVTRGVEVVDPASRATAVIGGTPNRESPTPHARPAVAMRRSQALTRTPHLTGGAIDGVWLAVGTPLLVV